MAERDPIDLLREQLNRADELSGLHSEQEAFVRWVQETRTILEKVFNPQSVHIQSFLALRFREVSVKAFGSPEIDRINSARFKRDLEHAKNILQGAIKELTLDRTLFKKIQTTPRTVEVALKGEYFVASKISSSELLPTIETALRGSGLKPIQARETNHGSPSLPERIDRIRRARFGIYDLSAPEKDEILLELGIALGLGREVIVVHKKGVSIPESIRSVEQIEYETFSDLPEKLRKRLKL